MRGSDKDQQGKKNPAPITSRYRGKKDSSIMTLITVLQIRFYDPSYLIESLPQVYIHSDLTNDLWHPCQIKSVDI